jgi:6-pyruvoyltetrahydropterin/6-carboxytetrahydropterin synthase
MLKISKNFEWEMGHRLMNHKGLCINPHGHSYKMRVVIESETANNIGMVMDYYELDKIVWEVLEDFNHSFVINENDLVMKDFLMKNDFKSVILPFDSTAENLCEVFGNIIQNKLKKYKNIKTLTIRLYETRDVYAEKSMII